MINNEQPSNDILARLNISFMELSQMATIAGEDNIKDFNDDDINMEMNKQVPL
jgi:hypothetical protein